MTSSDVAVSLLDRARKAADGLDARILLAASVNRIALEIGSRTIASGGTAVDFYAAGASGTSESYPAKWAPSGDVDLVVMEVPGSNATIDTLRDALGTRLGLHPRHPGVRRAIDVPDFPYGLDIFASDLERDPQGERVVTILVDSIHPVHFRGPEDTILAYGESGWDTRHSRDWERALAMYSAMKEKVDLPWMYAEADRRKQRRVLDAIVRGEPSPWRKGS